MFALLPPLLLVQLTALSPMRATCSLSSHPQPQQKRPHCLLVRVQKLRLLWAMFKKESFAFHGRRLCSTTINHFISQQLSISCFHTLRLQIRQRTSPAHAQGAEARNTELHFSNSVTMRSLLMSIKRLFLPDIPLPAPKEATT